VARSFQRDTADEIEQPGRQPGPAPDTVCQEERNQLVPAQLHGVSGRCHGQGRLIAGMDRHHPGLLECQSESEHNRPQW